MPSCPRVAAALASSLLLCLLVGGLLGGCGPGLEQRIQRAQILVDDGRFEELLPEMTELHRAAPRNPEVNHLYGLTLLRTRNGGMAVWPLRVAARTPGREVEDGMLLAEALASGSVPEDALPAIDRVLEFDPDLIEAWVLRSNVNHSLRRLEDVLEDCGTIAELGEAHVHAVLCQIDALSSLKRFDEAEALLAESLPQAESRAALPPRLGRRFCVTGAGLAQRAGDEARAKERWEACIAKSPTSLELIEPALTFFDETGDTERGTEILRNAVAETPHRFDLVSALAKRLEGVGRDEEARSVLEEATTRTRTSRRAWIALADYHRQRDEFDKAIASLDRVLAEDESIPVLLVAQYADDLIQFGDFERADSVIAQLPAHPMVSLLRGRALLEQGETVSALEELDRGLELWPSNSTARYLAGQASERSGDIDRALEEYRNAIRHDQAHTPAAIELARLLEAEGNLTAALVALGHRVDAVPDDVDAHLAALRIARRTGRISFATELLESLARIPDERVNHVVESASLALLQGGPSAAAKSIVDADLDLAEPSNSRALAALCHYLVLEGSQADALERVERALAAHPDAAHFHEIRGVVLLAASSEPADAKAAFERSLELEADRATVLARLAQLAVNEGDDAAAISLFDRANASDPEDSDHAWRALRALMDSSGLAHARGTGQEEEIDARVRALLDQDPIHGAAARLHAERLLAKAGLDEGSDRDAALEEAMEYAKRAVRFGGSPSAIIVRARVSTAIGQAGAAVEILRRLESREPRYPSIWYQLGVAYEEAGATDRARAALERALEGGDFDEASEARQALGRLEEAPDA